MTAKEYLERVKKIDSKINRLTTRRERLKECMYSFSESPEGERVQTSRNVDKFGSLYAKIDDIEREIKERKEEITNLQIELALEIDELPDFNQKQVLVNRYVYLKSWQEISKKVGYSEGYIFQLHRQALKEFEKVLDQSNIAESQNRDES